MLGAFSAHALPQNFTVEGRLYDSNGTPLNDTNVTVMLEVLVVDPNDNASLSCVIYRETHTNVNVASPDPSSIGVFALRLGTGALNYPATAPSFAQIFSPGSFNGNSDGSSTPNCTVNAQDSYTRLIRTSIKTASITSYEALVPDTRISPVPQAFVAETANTIGNYGTADLLIANGTSANLTQDNLLNVFSTTNYSTLLNLLSSGTASFGNRTIASVATPVISTDATNKGYVDANLGGKALDVSNVGTSGDGDTLTWSVSQNKWVAAPLILNSTGVTASTYGSATRFTSFTVGADGRVTNAVDYPLTALGTASGDLTGSYPAPSINTSAVTTAKIADGAITSLKLNATAAGVNRLVITDGVTGATLGYASCGALDQIMVWSATGWKCSTVASLSAVTSVAGKSGAVTLNAADVGGLGTAALLNWGTAAGQVVALNGTAQLPSVDGSLLTNVNATRIASQLVSPTVGTSGQVLSYNGASSQWTPTTIYISPGVGLTGGLLASTNTISVNIGTGASMVVGENNSAQIAQSFGSATAPAYSFKNDTQSGLFSPATSTLAFATHGNTALTINALGQVGIGTAAPSTALEVYGTGQFSAIQVPRDTAANRPPVGANGMIRYNTTASALETFSAGNWQTVAVGTSVQSITAGTGLSGGTITNNGTLNVNVGNGPNLIPQENGSSQLLQVTSTSSTPAYSFSGFTNSGLFGTSDTVGISVNNLAMLNVKSNAVGIGTVSPGAFLDVNGLGANSSMLVPRDTAGARPTGVNGMLRYNTSTSSMEIYASGAWQTLSTTSNTGVSIATGTGLLGGPITTSGTLAVNVGSAAYQIVQENGAHQIAQLPSGVNAPGYSFANSTSTGLFYNTISLGLSFTGTTAFSVDQTGASTFWNLLSTNQSSYNPYSSPSASASTAGTNALTLNNPASLDGNYSGLQFVAANAASTTQSGYIGAVSQASAQSSNLVFGHQTGPNSVSELMRLDYRGYVGIGTTNPASALDVYATGSSSAIIVPRDTTTNRPSGTPGMIRYNTSLSQFEFFQNTAWININGLSFPLTGAQTAATAPQYTFSANTTTGMYLPTAKTLGFTTNGISALIIDPNQNVGIGTTAPNSSYILDVEGKSSGKSINLTAGDSASGSAGNILLNPGTGASGSGLVQVSGYGLAMSGTSSFVTTENTNVQQPSTTLLGALLSVCSGNYCIAANGSSYISISLTTNTSLKCIQGGVAGQHLWLTVNNTGSGTISNLIAYNAGCNYSLGTGYAPVKYNQNGNIANIPAGGVANYHFIYDSGNNVWQLFSEH